MTCSETRIVVWTIQTVDFDISEPGIKSDHTRGYYWKTAPESPGWTEYRSVLPALLNHFKVESILWCFPTLIGRCKSAEQDKVVWELDLPKSSILERFDGFVWRDVIAGKAPLDFSKLCIPRDEPTRDLGKVLIAMPLHPDSQTKRLGQLQGDGRIAYSDMKQLGACVSLCSAIP